MSDSKIDFTFENLHFACEGEKDWVERQLNQVLNRIPGLAQPKESVAANAQEELAVETAEEMSKSRGRRGRRAATPAKEGDSDNALANYLIAVKADKNQVRKFLAVASFLQTTENMQKFTTPVISQTLKKYGVEKLLNASDCLNKNEKKGYCIKDDKEFTITEAGQLSISNG